MNRRLSPLRIRASRKYLTLLMLVVSLAMASGLPAAGPEGGAADANSPGTGFAGRLAEARRAFFADLAGQHGADDRARQQFAALAAERPNEPVVDAYLGSLDLLESARTFAVWRKHTLAADGLGKLDAAVNRAPDNLEARFVRALTTWHLPFFFHRKEQAEDDLGFIAPRAEQAARQGSLPAPQAAAALDYWGQVLADRDAGERSQEAFAAAVRVDPASPGGEDARKRLGAKQ
jgi:hypothetical protein